jgi:hypothetical protein
MASLGWFEGIILIGNQGFSHSVWGFPVNFPKQTNPSNGLIGLVFKAFLNHQKCCFLKSNHLRLDVKDSSHVPAKSCKLGCFKNH